MCVSEGWWGPLLQLGEGSAEILGGAQAGVCAPGGLRGWKERAGDDGWRRVSGGRVEVAEEAPPQMQKTLGGVDGEFATWRFSSERGSIL